MRIIAGAARGRSLKTLPGLATRPTSGKVRAALFSSLAAWVADADWLDLYAGSGAIGLEALSRGARRAVLVERAPEALGVIRENVASTRLVGAEVMGREALAALSALAGQRFDVVFLDPPYAEDPVPAAVAAAGLLKADGRLVVEHRSDRPLPETLGGLVKQRTRAYAETCLSVFAPAADSPEAKDT